MGKVLEQITAKEEKFIRQQKVFFVATSPLSNDGHVNVSPKSPGTSVIVLDPMTVCYIDLTGSGSETAAHVLENGRMTLMFCNVEHGFPMILRLYGTATFITKADVPQSWIDQFPPDMVTSDGFRCVYKLDVHRISSSCGYSLPCMTFQSYRNVLNEFTTKQGPDGMKNYRLRKNAFSIDGMPSLAHFDKAIIDSNDPDNAIVEDPADGYVFGKVVSKQSKDYQDAEQNRGNLPSPASVIQKQKQHCWKKMTIDPWIMFGAGLLLGTLITGVTFHSAK